MHGVRVAVLIAANFLAFVMPAWAADEAVTADIALATSLVESADTPAEHKALAGYYQAEATRQRMMALSHRKMGDSYMRAKLHRTAEEQQHHCEKIAGLEEQISQVYERMAETHEQQSKP